MLPLELGKREVFCLRDTSSSLASLQDGGDPTPRIGYSRHISAHSSPSSTQAPKLVP